MINYKIYNFCSGCRKKWLKLETIDGRCPDCHFLIRLKPVKLKEREVIRI